MCGVLLYVVVKNTWLSVNMTSAPLALLGRFTGNEEVISKVGTLACELDRRASGCSSQSNNNNKKYKMYLLEFGAGKVILFFDLRSKGRWEGWFEFLLA